MRAWTGNRGRGRVCGSGGGFENTASQFFKKLLLIGFLINLHRSCDFWLLAASHFLWIQIGWIKFCGSRTFWKFNFWFERNSTCWRRSRRFSARSQLGLSTYFTSATRWTLRSPFLFRLCKSTLAHPNPTHHFYFRRKVCWTLNSCWTVLKSLPRFTFDFRNFRSVFCEFLPLAFLEMWFRLLLISLRDLWGTEGVCGQCGGN